MKRYSSTLGPATQRIRSEIDQIAQIDSELTKSRIVAFVTETFNQIQSRGPSAVSWQQAELAVHLTYIFGELQRTCESMRVASR